MGSQLLGSISPKIEELHLENNNLGYYKGKTSMQFTDALVQQMEDNQFRLQALNLSANKLLD